jgi:predicted porin
MNKIVASVGLVALGTAGLQTVAAVDLTSEGAKPWGVSVALRGFYDDNTASAPNDTSVAGHRGSVGYSASPGITLALQNDQSSLNLGYTFSALYYAHRPPSETDNYDLDHTFNLSLNHNFNERYKVAVVESFVDGQEPDALRAGNVFNSFERVPGSNIRNFGSLTFDAVLTPLFSLEAGFANAFYDYRGIAGGVPNGGDSSPDIAGLLNRVEDTFHLDGRYQWQPDTIFIVGAQFMDSDYLANERIDGIPGGSTSPIPLYSRVRDNRAYYGYLGVDHTFRPDLTGSLRAGGRYNDYYNDPTSQNEPSPYVMATARYTYMMESYLEAGVSYDRSATDLFSVAQNGSITTDAQSAAFWVTCNHRITPKIYANLTAQVQNSTYDGGVYNNENDMYYLVGLSLQYKFSSNFSAEIGYNYDRLDSDSAINAYEEAQNGAGRSFDRNRVYLGVTASY